MQQACSDRDIIFMLMDKDQLPLGRRNLLRHPQALDPEGHAHGAWKRGVDGLSEDAQ